MRVWLMTGAASLLGGGAYLGGMFDRGEYYPMPAAAVEARLAGLRFSSEPGGNAGHEDIDLILRSRGPTLLRWDLMMSGRKTAEVRANLDPDSPGTRVSVEFQFTDSEATMGLENDPFLNDVAQIAMTEKIDSTLDGRAFDPDIVAAKMAALVAANPEAITNMQQTMHDNLDAELRSMGPVTPYGGGGNTPVDNGGWGSSGGSYRSDEDGGWGSKSR